MTATAPTGTTSSDPIHARMRLRAQHAGVQRIHIFTFRDRDDPTAGGAEEHAYWVCRHLALAGLDVVLHTGGVEGEPTEIERDGFTVYRRGGHLSVFATSVSDYWRGRLGPADAVVEIFHGVPFFTPLWARKPQVAVVHHVHLGTWHLLLPGPLGRVGHCVEQVGTRLFYRRRAMITAAPSARDEIIEHYKTRADRISVVPHGIAARFSPGGVRSERPLVVAVGRFMPQKGWDDLLPVLAEVRRRVPDLEVVIVGDGPQRASLEARVDELGAAGWLHFKGRVDDDELVGWYRRAWLLANASLREGFGLTITEAAACATPAVVTRIPGHLDAVDDGVSGLLADDMSQLADLIEKVLVDDELRASLSAGAVAHARQYSWEESAAALLDILCEQAEAESSACRRSPRLGRWLRRGSRR